MAPVNQWGPVPAHLCPGAGHTNLFLIKTLIENVRVKLRKFFFIETVEIKLKAFQI